MQIRPGSDLAVLGGLIRYALENDLHHADYVRAHTNATFVVGEDYGFADGLFAGFDESASNYDKTAWDYERGPTATSPRPSLPTTRRCSSCSGSTTTATRRGGRRRRRLLGGRVPCRWAEIICSTGAPTGSGRSCNAVGWTMHTVGASQTHPAPRRFCSCCSATSAAGGGINALRGHANVQGATDHAIVAGILPGYLKVPTPPQTSLAAQPGRLDAAAARPRHRQLLGQLPRSSTSRR